jgi:hypothetical protein
VPERLEPDYSNVRLGSQADILGGLRDVRFTPESGHRLSALGCPLRAGGGFVLIYGDITTRKRAEEAIRAARDAASILIKRTPRGYEAGFALKAGAAAGCHTRRKREHGTEAPRPGCS